MEKILRTDELMIGDWVRLLPPMGEMRPSELFCIREIDDLYFAECGRCVGIRLTSGILDKFGFVEKYQRKRFRYRVENCSFVIECVPPRNLSVFMNEEYAGSFEILYVHELQHLLKLLRVNKDIEL